MKIAAFKARSEQLAQWLLVAEFAAFPVFMGLANTLLLLILIAWVCAGNFKERWTSIRSNRLTPIALGLYALILLGALWSPANGQEIGLHFAKYSKLIIALIFMSVLTTPAWRERCLLAFCAGMLFILCSVYANIWIDLPWSKTQNHGWGQDHHVIGDYITQNIMLSFFVLIALTRCARPGALAHRIAWGACALLASISIVQLSKGRTGLILLITNVLVFLYYMSKSHWSTKQAVGIFLCAFLFVVTAIGFSQQMQARLQLAWSEAKNFEQDHNTSVGHRVYAFTKSAELIQKNPLLGHGTGAFHQVLCTVLDPKDECKLFNWHPDNQYFLFGVDLGFLGIALFLGLMYSMLLNARSASPEVRILMVAWAFMLAINSLFNSSFFSSRENHFFLYLMALLGASVATHERSR